MSTTVVYENYPVLHDMTVEHDEYYLANFLGRPLIIYLFKN